MAIPTHPIGGFSVASLAVEVEPSWATWFVLPGPCTKARSVPAWLDFDWSRFKRYFTVVC